MLFYMIKEENSIIGWVSPDNPSTRPTVEIVQPHGRTIEFVTNQSRPDVKEAGLHYSGENGFVINSETVPGIDIDNVEIRDKHTGLTIYRPFDETRHVKLRLSMFDQRAMPNAALDQLWKRKFNLYYNAVERFPLDTMFGLLNNPGSESIGLVGRFSLFRYEHLLRAAEHKIIALLRDPIEELAERLLFIRYATSSQNLESFNNYLTGLEGIATVARRIDLAEPKTLNEAFIYLPEKQRAELANPLTRALACNVNEDPTGIHVEFALSRLAALDLVGIQSHYDKFKSSALELFGVDILGDKNPPIINEAVKLAEHLAKAPMVQSLMGLDMRLYKYIETAIRRAVEPQESGLDEDTIRELSQFAQKKPGKQIKTENDTSALR